jgi:hypothetical protein
MDSAEALANACLVAAAPDMYEALVALMREVDLSGNGEARDFGWPTVCKQARAAIAKAEGKQ